MSNQKPAEIAKANKWKVGDVIQAKEEMRYAIFFLITAIGHEMVLGRRFSIGRKLGNEIPLALDDEFIEWDITEWRSELYAETKAKEETPLYPHK